jgi:hypothetical protein
MGDEGFVVSWGSAQAGALGQERVAEDVQEGSAVQRSAERGALQVEGMRGAITSVAPSELGGWGEWSGVAE